MDATDGQKNVRLRCIFGDLLWIGDGFGPEGGGDIFGIGCPLADKVAEETEGSLMLHRTRQPVAETPTLFLINLISDIQSDHQIDMMER